MEDAPRAWITRDRLAADLRALDLAAGQVVIFHASVKSVGWVVGGPDVIIQSLLDVLGPEGTLCMYTSWEEWEQVLVSYQSLPEEAQFSYREACPPFDPHTSRANRKWSILTEYLRTWPGALRSDHPTASVAAVGARAAWITADHPLQYGYGYGSPWDKICQAGGKVLVLGCDLTSLTILHYAEHICAVPNKRVVRNEVPMLVNGERRWVVFEEYDTTSGIRELDSSEYFDRVAQDYLSAGNGRQGLVGSAWAYLFDAADLARFGAAWMEQTWKE